jgi:dihydroorotase
VKLKLVDGQYLSPDQTWKSFKSIYIEDGKVKSIDQDADIDTERTIDCSGLRVIPALIDLNVTLKKATTNSNTEHSEVNAAVAGGVSTFCCSPDISPINDSPAASKLLASLASAQSKVEILPLGALTQQLQGEALSEYAELRDAGCIGLSNAYLPINDLLTTKRCFDYAHTYGLSVFVHPMERSLYQGSMHSGSVSTMLGLQGISYLAESIAVSQLIMLAKNSGAHLHLAQVSCKESVDLIRKAKNDGLTVTADVAIANLVYTHEAVQGFSSVFHCCPPLRDETDRLSLINAVKDGTIDAICSAHQPCGNSDKQAPFAESAKGLSTIEHLMHYAKMLDNSGELSVEAFVKAMTLGASKALKRHAPLIEIGASANLAIISSGNAKELKAGSMKSFGKNSPIIGHKLLTEVTHTLRSGELVYEKQSS